MRHRDPKLIQRSYGPVNNPPMDNKTMGEQLAKLLEWNKAQDDRLEMLEEKTQKHSGELSQQRILLTTIIAKIDSSKFWIGTMLALLGLALKFL